MKFGTGSNAERTQKYAGVKVQNDIRTSIHTDKQTSPIFNLCYPCKCLARYARSPIIITIILMTIFID